MIGLDFLAIFSQTHLVTLAVTLSLSLSLRCPHAGSKPWRDLESQRARALSTTHMRQPRHCGLSSREGGQRRTLSTIRYPQSYGCCVFWLAESRNSYLAMMMFTSTWMQRLLLFGRFSYLEAREATVLPPLSTLCITLSWFLLSFPFLSRQRLTITLKAKMSQIGRRTEQFGEHSGRMCGERGTRRSRRSGRKRRERLALRFALKKNNGKHRLSTFLRAA
jgi:hypothetical protein